MFIRREHPLLSVFPAVVSLPIFFACCIAPLCEAELLFSHCQGPIDLGGFEKQGNIQNTCIRDHHFYNESHPWILSDSSITNTNFTECTFHNTADIVQAFNNTQWEDVIFRDCTFAAANDTSSSSTSLESSSVIKFSHFVFFNVHFINCTFEAPVDVVFSNFALSIVSFYQCNFLGRLIGLKGDMWNVKFRHSYFGTDENRTTVDGRHPGDTIFALVNLYDVTFLYNDGRSNALMVASATVEAFKISYCTMGAFRCVVAAETVGTSGTCSASSTQCVEKLVPAYMNSTVIHNTTLVDGLNCTGVTAMDFYMRNITIGGAIDFSQGTVDGLTIDTVQSINFTTPSNTTNVTVADTVVTDIRLVDAIIRSGRRLAYINTTNITLTGATFEDAIGFIGVKISDIHVDARDATFSQETIGGECCSVACDTKECICDFHHDPVICPEANASSRSSRAGGGSCFPAGGMLWLREGDMPRFAVKPTRMDHVRVGHASAAGLTGSEIGGKVFFFGHRNPVAIGTYLVISASVRNISLPDRVRKGMSGSKVKVRLSGGHYLPIVHKGLQPARLVLRNDELYTVWGPAVVTHIGVERAMGMYAPVTTTGDMIVDGVFVSCFTEVVDSVMATALLSPIRWLFLVGGKTGRFIVSHARLLDVWSGAGFVSTTRGMFSRMS